MTPVSAPPATLPRLSANQARALSLIAAHGSDFAVTLPALADAVPADGDAAAGATWRLGFAPGAPEPLRDAAAWRIDLEWAGASLRLHLPAGALTAWTNARLPALGPDELPEPLRAAALETLLDEALAALASRSSGGPLRVRGMDAGDAPRLPHAWTLAARSAASGDTVLAVLETDDLGLMMLAGMLAQLPPAAHAHDDGALPVRLRAVVGAATLPAAELRSLGGGDVILLDEYLVGPQGELWLAAPHGQGLRVRAEKSSYFVTQGWTSLMTDTSSQAESGEAAGHAEHAAEPLAVDAIPVRLSFDLGERSMTLAELRQLQPGAVFDLQRPLADGPVMIRANGALLGTGELVDIDGRIGVRVSMLGKGGA